jgi:hypothetical protein
MSTPLIFLYQTRTILRCRRVPSISRSLHISPCRHGRSNNDIPFAQDVAPEILDEAQSRDTITPTERQTFNQIFSDIAARGLQPQPQIDKKPSESTRRTTNLIVEAAVAGESGQENHSKSLSAAQYSSIANEKDKALLRFPPSLRAAASRAFELLNPGRPVSYSPPTAKKAKDSAEESNEIWHASKNSMMELEAKRYPEQKRIETLMSSARTDFELWDIMEREVFSYPDRLGLRNVNVPRQPGGKQKRKTVKSQSTGQTTAKDLKQPRGKHGGNSELDLYIFGPLYPSSLLFGLRLLDKAFATPSLLALSVLPRIKALGLESFVLGVSTPFYNELLSIYFDRYGDLSNMMSLLEEMSHSGLYFDNGTAAILSKAYSQTRTLSTGAHGHFAQALMTMPAYESSVQDRIKYWHSHIALSINQRDSDVELNKLYQL